MGESEIKTQVVGEVHLITLPISLGEDMEKEICVSSKTWLLERSSLHILDFKSVNHLDNTVIKQFVLFNQALKKNGKYLASINMPDIIRIQVNEKGLSEVFSPRANLKEALRLAGVKLGA